MSDLHSWGMVLVIAAVTALLRFLPFRIFGNGRETPAFISYLGKVLPYPIMAMLVVYCLKSVSLRQAPHGIPEFLACAVTAGIHSWKKNTLLSILVGTVAYCLLIRAV